MNDLNSTKCILFDLDNTLWDFDGNANIALSQLFNKHRLGAKTGKTDNDFIEIYKKVNARYWKKYEKGLVKKEVLRTRRFVDALLEMGLEEKNQPKGLWQEYLNICPTIPHLIPNAIETLKKLKKEFKIGILTNGFEQTQKIKLKSSGIEPYVDFMLSSEKFGIPKPHKAIFEKALNMAQLDKEEVIYIGDNRETDVLGGLNAGLKTAWFTEVPTPAIAHPLYLGHYSYLPSFAAFVLDSRKNDILHNKGEK